MSATIIYKNTYYTYIIDKKMVIINGEEKILSIAPIQRNDRLYLPVVQCVEFFNGSVDYRPPLLTIGFGGLQMCGEIVPFKDKSQMVAAAIRHPSKDKSDKKTLKMNNTVGGRLKKSFLGDVGFLNPETKKHIHIVIQHYGDAAKVLLPLHQDIILMLKQAGWTEVDSEDNSDATLKIEVNGKALGKKYNDYRYHYSGASLSLRINMVNKNNVYFDKNMNGNIEPTEIIDINYALNPNDAPFLNIYENNIMPKIVSAFSEQFGLKPIIFTLCELSYNHPTTDPELWEAEYKPLYDALENNILFNGKSLPYLQQLETELKLADSYKGKSENNRIYINNTLDKVMDMLKKIKSL